MKWYGGKITFIVKEDIATPLANALDAEIYLNGDVSNDIFKRFGIAIRVHIRDDEKEKRNG